MEAFEPHRRMPPRRHVLHALTAWPAPQGSAGVAGARWLRAYGAWQ